MPSRQGCLEPGTAAFMGCGSARQTGCMRQLPGKHRRIRQAAEWLFRPTHGVWGQGCVGGGGGSDSVAPLWYLFMPPTGDRSQDLLMVSKPKPRWGNLTQKAKGHWRRGYWRKGPCPIQLPPLNHHPSGHTSTWPLLSVHSDILTFSKLFQTLSWLSSCSVKGLCLCWPFLQKASSYSPKSQP